MENFMESKARIQKTKFRRKVALAAALLVIFACVVFSIPPERLAWQAPYVMGTLLLPKPSMGPYVRPAILEENTDSTLSLLAFLSAAGILCILARKFPDFPNAPKTCHVDPGLPIPIKDKITIMYIL